KKPLFSWVTFAFPCINVKMTEEHIIKEIRAGNQRVLADTYQQYRTEFIHWAYKKYNYPMEDGREVYQVSFFIFYDNVMSGTLENMISNLKTYLFAIGKNKILESHRRNARHVYDVKEEILKSDEEDLELQHDKEVQYRQISRALQKLGDPCKRILQMVYYQNRSMEFITESL